MTGRERSTHRWMMCMLCRTSSVSRRGTATLVQTACSVMALPSLSNLSRRSPPSPSSIISQNMLASWKAWYRRVTPGTLQRAHPCLSQLSINSQQSRAARPPWPYAHCLRVMVAIMAASRLMARIFEALSRALLYCLTATGMLPSAVQVAERMTLSLHV